MECELFWLLPFCGQHSESVSWARTMVTTIISPLSVTFKSNCCNYIHLMLKQFLQLKCKFSKEWRKMFHPWYLLGGSRTTTGRGEMGQMMSFPVFSCPLLQQDILPLPTAKLLSCPATTAGPNTGVFTLYFLYRIISNGWIGLYHKSFWHFHRNHRPPSHITYFSDCQYYWTPPLQSSGSSGNVQYLLKINSSISPIKIK